MIRLVRTNEKMVRQRCNVTLQDSISAEELKTRLTLKSIKEGLENWRLQWFNHLQGQGKLGLVNAEPLNLLSLDGKPERK